MTETIFDKIVSGEVPSYKLWEDDQYIAFLSIFPNTPGHTVVAKKQNPGDYIFTVDQDSFIGIMAAAKKVARMLEKAFDTDRVGVVIHGLGVPHLHVQLIPFHANLDPNIEVAAKYRQDHPEFAAELTAADGPKMEDNVLEKIQKKIVEAG